MHELIDCFLKNQLWVGESTNEEALCCMEKMEQQTRANIITTSNGEGKLTN